MNLGVIFLTGLTVGGLTCLAVQGGLLASVIATREGEINLNRKKYVFYVTSVFLVSKLIAYTILGFILGGFGDALNISGNLQTWMQFIAGMYMLIVALNLLEIHPVFRYFILQPPRFLAKAIHNQSKSKAIFAPLLLGAMTIFIPCGTTLGIGALAISSANAIVGAAIMNIFILGTIPLFLGIGFLTAVLGEALKSKFFKLAAIIVLYLGLTSINGSLVAWNFPLTISFNFDTGQSSMEDIKTNQNPEILITSNGYSPNYIKVKKGEVVNLKLISKDAYSCASAFRIPSLKIAKNLKVNETQTVSFIPREVGKIPFSCSMGMYKGVIEVI